MVSTSDSGSSHPSPSISGMFLKGVECKVEEYNIWRRPSRFKSQLCHLIAMSKKCYFSVSRFPYLVNEIVNICWVVGRINKLMDLGEYRVHRRNSVEVSSYYIIM